MNINDYKVTQLRDGFNHIADKGMKSNVPESVILRNVMLAELLTELLDYRQRNLLNVVPFVPGVLGKESYKSSEIL